MNRLIPGGILGEMLSSNTADIDKRIELAQEQLQGHEACAERLRNTIEILKRKKKEEGDAPND